MFEYMIHSSIFMKTIAACSFLGVISWLVLEIAYRSMIRSTTQIGKTKKKWLTALRKKYEDYHEMNVKVNNVATFVDRLFRKKKILGFTTSFWLTLERLSIAGCAIAGAAGALAASQQGAALSEVMISYLTGITAACSLLFLDTFLRAEEKRKIVLVNMNDYLENVLENSIQDREIAEDAVSRRARKRTLLRYAEENRKKKTERPVSPEEEKQYLRIISDESRRLSRLVRRMLDVSQLQSMDLIKQKKPFDLSESMRRVLVSMEKKITDRGLDVDVEIPDEPVIVMGDNDLLTQVVYNLLENAAKFAAPNSTLFLGLERQERKAVVTVRNIGDTIPPEELPLLFERFHKTDKSRSEDKDGVGLGLYIVRTILEQHRETITATSENGVTTFAFTVQLAEEGRPGKT